MIDLTYFNRLDIEFIVFTFTYDNTLFVVLQILVIILTKLVPETHSIIIDDIMVMIDIIINLRLCFCLLLPPHY